MPELEDKPFYIHQVVPGKSAYTFDKKLLDLITLASAPSLSSSNTTYKRIQKRIDFEQRHIDKLKGFKMNGFDEHIFFSSQQNEGILTKEAIEDCAEVSFLSDEARKSFLDYAKFRLGYLAFLGLLNDVSESDRYYEEKTTVQDKDGTKELTVKVKLEFKYEINRNFYKYLLDYQQKKELELREKFEFGKFDVFIYSFLQKNSGCIDLDSVKKEKVSQTIEKAANVIYQARMMKDLGYLEEAALDIFTPNKDFKKKLDSGTIYLNTAEKKIVEFIERHGVFSLDKYRIDQEVEAESCAGILKSRLGKLIKLGFLQKCKSTYSFTPEGENRLKGFYAENFEFTSFDQNILNSNRDGIIDLEEIEAELESRYGSTSAMQTFERQKERLFIMECAGLVKKESANIYSLTGKGALILEEENRVYTEEKRAVLQQTFKYNDDAEEFYQLIKSKGSTVYPDTEVKAILDTVDTEKGMVEFNACNMVMRNYKCLGTADIDAEDEVKLNVKLGYIVQNQDGTLSLTVKGKNLVNVINSKEDDKRIKALSNKKFKLLNDIDKNCNRLDPKVYLKTQRIIADKEQRRTVNLLRYQPEKLYLVGLLGRNQDGSYSITPLFEKYSSEFKQKKLQDEIDGFNFSNVHKFMLKFCRGNEFSLERYRQYISRKLSGKALDREMCWKKSSCEKLTRVGYFEKVDDNTYRLTAKGIEQLKAIRNEEKTVKKKAYEERAAKEFKPGANHKYLLKFAKDGILDFKDVEDRILKLPKSKQSRELTMKKGMLKKLAAAGYLETFEGVVSSQDSTAPGLETGVFRLTQKAVMFLEGRSDTEPEADRKPDNTQLDTDNGPVQNVPATDSPTDTQEAAKEAVLKITKFDIDNIISLSTDGKLLKTTVEQSPKAASILKRINTLVVAGMLVESDDGWILTGELLDRAAVRKNINTEHEKSHSKYNSIACLTAEQKKTVVDIKDFLNLSGSQILKHIYNGNEALFKSDIRYLLDKGIIRKDKCKNIYFFTQHGKKIATELTGDEVIFESKILKRRTEIRHDILFYSAYKDAEKELSEHGKTIISFKTDRKLRSEDMKNNRTLKGEYPDIHIVFKDNQTGEEGFINLEIDVGYTDKDILGKLVIPNLRWYTTSNKQKEKVLKKAKNMKVKIIDEEYWR